MKYIKGLHKCTRWSPAYKLADKMSKDFLNTIPLIAALGGKYMRDRHWKSLMTATSKTFVPPYEDPDMLIGDNFNLSPFNSWLLTLYQW